MADAFGQNFLLSLFLKSIAVILGDKIDKCYCTIFLLFEQKYWIN